MMNDSSNFDIANMISRNREIYQKPVTAEPPAPKQQLQLPEFSQMNGSLSQNVTITNLMNMNQMYYQTNVPNPARKSLKEKEPVQSYDEQFSECLTLSLIEEIVNLNQIYNYKTIIKRVGMDIQEAGMLDKIQIQRRERQKKAVPDDLQQPSIMQKKKNHPATQVSRPYKNYLSKISMDETGKIKLYCVDLSRVFDRQFWIVTLNPVDFGSKRPGSSMVQDKCTGRFFLYDNSNGKILIYSPEILTNSSKDRPLIAMSMNEDPPRQDPLLYIYEDNEEDGMSKSVLMVVGGYHKGKGKKQRPLKTIKIFEVKKRDVSLTPISTLVMMYPRMHPIMFTLNNKAWMWQRNNNELNKEEQKTEATVKEEQVLMIMGGNILNEQMLAENMDISDQMQDANRTCEYIPMQRILDYITRAQMVPTTNNLKINAHEDEITDDVQGMNYSKFKIEDQLNIKFQSQSENSRVHENLHHACVVTQYRKTQIKQADDVFTNQSVYYIIGGGSVEIYQIANIFPQQFEISLKLSNLYNEKVTNIHSRSMTSTFEKQVYFMDDSNHEGIYKLGIVQRSSNRESKCCSMM